MGRFIHSYLIITASVEWEAFLGTDPVIELPVEIRMCPPRIVYTTQIFALPKSLCLYINYYQCNIFLLEYYFSGKINHLDGQPTLGIFSFASFIQVGNLIGGYKMWYPVDDIGYLFRLEDRGKT